MPAFWHCLHLLWFFLLCPLPWGDQCGVSPPQRLPLSRHSKVWVVWLRVACPSHASLGGRERGSAVTLQHRLPLLLGRGSLWGPAGAPQPPTDPAELPPNWPGQEALRSLGLAWPGLLHSVAGKPVLRLTERMSEKSLEQSRAVLWKRTRRLLTSRGSACALHGPASQHCSG